MWPYYDNWGHGWLCPMQWMSIMVVLTIVVILVVLFVSRGMFVGNAGRDAASSSARKILDERYAKGEIDREQYEQMKKDIG